MESQVTLTHSYTRHKSRLSSSATPHFYYIPTTITAPSAAIRGQQTDITPPVTNGIAIRDQCFYDASRFTDVFFFCRCSISELVDDTAVCVCSKSACVCGGGGGGGGDPPFPCPLLS